MKITGQEKLLVNQPGTVKIIPEEPDDFWLLYNLIIPDDIAAADTTRKVHQTSVFGAVKNPTRVKCNIELKVTAIDLDNNSCVLWLKGKTTTSNSYVSGGAFHTLEIENHKPFTLRKRSWDAASIESLIDGSKRSVGADLAVLLIKEGVALFYLVGRSMCDSCAKVEGNKGNATKFLEGVFHAFRKHVDFGVVRCLVIAGPGMVKEDFRQYMLGESQRLRLKPVLDNRSRVVVVNVGSISKEGLSEVLQDPGVMNLIKDAKCGVEVRAIRDLNDMISSNSDRACYGPKSVDMAHELAAIETLLITDDLFRNGDAALRQKYAELVESVKKSGGKALVFSSMHISGEQLAQLTGIAAILRFPLPDIEEMEL